MKQIQLLTDNDEHTGVWMEIGEAHVRLIGGLAEDGTIYVLPNEEQGLDMPREYAEKVWGPLEKWLHEIPLDESATV